MKSLPFCISGAWERYPFWAEPSCIGSCVYNFKSFVVWTSSYVTVKLERIMTINWINYKLLKLCCCCWVRPWKACTGNKIIAKVTIVLIACKDHLLVSVLQKHKISQTLIRFFCNALKYMLTWSPFCYGLKNRDNCKMANGPVNAVHLR